MKLGVRDLSSTSIFEGELMKLLEKILEAIKCLAFSLKEVFLSSPIVFCTILIIQLLNSLSFYVFLIINREIINRINELILFDTSEVLLYEIIGLLILSLIVSILFVFIGYINTLLIQKQDIKFNKYINTKMAKKCMELDISYFDNPIYYDKISKAQEGKTRLGFIVYRAIFFISNIVSFIFALTMSLATNVMNTIIVLVLTIPIFLTQGTYSKKKYIYEEQTQRIKRKISYLANIILGKGAAKEIRFYNMGDFVLNKYRDHWNTYSSGLKKIISRQGLTDSLFTILPTVGIMVAMYATLMNIIEGKNQIGDFSYCLGLYTAVYSSLFSLVDDVSKMGESELAIRNYNDFMSTTPILKYEGKKELKELLSIDFENVTFFYPGTELAALNDISLHLSPYKKNAIVGINGSGKTTLIKLLLRFYDVDYGKILINGVDIKEYDINDIRKCFSVVFQDYVLYSFSIRDNISISNLLDKNNDNRINEALELVGLKDIITNKKCTIDSFLSREFSDDGVELSGGQKQKIALARSAFSAADILILDEATSSLDTESEQNIVGKLEEIYKHKGIIYIAHRLAYMSSMDNIIVLKDGNVIEQGNHEELLEKKGEYFRLFCAQARKYEGKAL